LWTFCLAMIAVRRQAITPVQEQKVKNALSL